MLIKKNTVNNNITLTLTEKASAVNSDWLLKLTNDIAGSDSERLIALHDIGEYPSRANIFNITESVNEDLVNSIVCLNPTGQWSYEIFEMAPSSPRNMDTSQAIKMVETGRCFVEDDNELKENFFNDEDKKNSAVFEG